MNRIHINKSTFQTVKEDKQKQGITYNMEPENISELTMYFIDTFNKLAFSSKVSVELPDINRSTN